MSINEPRIYANRPKWAGKPIVKEEGDWVWVKVSPSSKSLVKREDYEKYANK